MSSKCNQQGTRASPTIYASNNQILSYSGDSTIGHSGINCSSTTVDPSGNLTARGNVTGSEIISRSSVQISNDTRPCPGAPAGTIGFNLGGNYDLSENHHLLFSAGRGLQHVLQTNQRSYYCGLQVTF